MAERIITAAEARSLREAATPGPWLAATDDEIEAGLGIIAPDNCSAEWPVCGTDTDGAMIVSTRDDLALMAAAPDLAASVEHHAARAERAERAEAERDRLARVLAVERGDASQAPEGWTANYAGDMWTRIVSGRSVWIHRFAPNGVSMWEMRGIRRDDPAHREWSTALEAMEAIDAGVTHAG